MVIAVILLNLTLFVINIMVIEVILLNLTLFVNNISQKKAQQPAIAAMHSWHCLVQSGK